MKTRFITYSVLSVMTLLVFGSCQKEQIQDLEPQKNIALDISNPSLSSNFNQDLSLIKTLATAYLSELESKKCNYGNCEQRKLELQSLVQPLADEYCTEFLVCFTCCNWDGEKIHVILKVEPQLIRCNQKDEIQSLRIEI